MGTKLGLVAALVVLLALTGCNWGEPTDTSVDCDALPAPGGVWTITGDVYVEVLWAPLHIADLAGYRIYYSDEAFGSYIEIGWSDDAYFLDIDVVNGVTYYYAVTAVDAFGNESELSYETIFDTPRPAGYGLIIWDYDEDAGVDFSKFNTDMIQPWDDWDTDMYLYWDNDDGFYELASTEVQIGIDIYGTDLQYAGWVDTLDELDWAPSGGWSVGTPDVVTLFEGHAYWVWTWDNYFAKFRVEEIGLDYVEIDWAYQIDEGNPELDLIGGGTVAVPGGKPPRPAAEPLRKPLVRNARPADATEGM